MSTEAAVVLPPDGEPPPLGSYGLAANGEALRGRTYKGLAAFGEKVLTQRAERLYRREERLGEAIRRRDKAVAAEALAAKRVEQGTHTLSDGPYAALERGIGTPLFLVCMALLAGASWFVNQAALLVLQLPLSVTLALATLADIGLLVAAHLVGDYWKRRHQARDFRRQLGRFENVGWVAAIVVAAGIVVSLATVRLLLSGLLGAMVIAVLLTLSFLVGAWLSYKHAHAGVRSLEGALRKTGKAQKQVRIATGLRNTAQGELDAALVEFRGIASSGLAEWRLLQQLYLDAILRDDPDAKPILPADPPWVEELEKLASGEALPELPSPRRP